MLVGTNPER